jgi:hypothetical protein
MELIMLGLLAVVVFENVGPTDDALGYNKLDQYHDGDY